MPDVGGVYTRSDGTRTGSTVCQQEKAASLGNTAALADAREQDMATALNNRLCRDGSNSPSANLPMNGKKHTGVAAANASGQYMEFDQVNAGFQPLDATLTALAGVTTAADKVIYSTDSDTFDTADFTSFGRTLAGSASAAAANEALAVSQSVTASGSSLSIDLSSGWVINLTLSASVSSVAFTNPPASGKFLRVVLVIASTGSFTMSGWPGTTIWAGGNAPTITSGSGKKDTLILTSLDGGTNFRGYVVAQNMS